MVGGRTHDYPHGKPFPLLLIDVGMVILGIVWVFMVPGHWSRAIGVIGIFVVRAFITTKLHKRYERTGEAVRIRRPLIFVKFPEGQPTPMLLARAAFFVTAAIMVGFGIGPLSESTARIGIIACVFALIGVALLNIGLEHHYVSTKRATEIDLRSSH